MTDLSDSKMFNDLDEQSVERRDLRDIPRISLVRYVWNALDDLQDLEIDLRGLKV